MAFRSRRRAQSEAASLLLAAAALAAAIGASFAATPVPALAEAPSAWTTPPSVKAGDTPDDWGSGLTVTWNGGSGTDSILDYELWRLETAAEAPQLPHRADGTPWSEALSGAGWLKVFKGTERDTSFVDSLDGGRRYAYVVIARTLRGEAASAPSAPARPARQIISRSRINILVAVLLFIGTVVALVERARRGAKLFIRKIAGLEAVEEAVGRATEMGRPILYVPGLDPMDEVATVAAVDILGQVAKKAGEYETKLVVPNRDPIVMAVAQQVVRESYSAVGKPHLYREENIFYVTYSQFGFAAAVAGLMLRERPATNFFVGHFYAESLVLAETGNATGAIQIAGTDSDAQLPFFITSCDYTLIGEELYAGSVYLSRQPLLLGALKSQDYAKLLLMAAMLVGIVLSAASPEAAATFRAIFR
jgi:hypothetical protein